MKASRTDSLPFAILLLLISGAGSLVWGGDMQVLRRPPVAAGAAPIAYVQSASSYNGFASTCVTAFGSNNASGNLLVIAVAFGSSSLTINSVVDTRSNTYTLIDRVDFVGSSLATYYAKNSGAGANTVTVTLSNSHHCTLAVQEYSGASTTAPLDVHNSAGLNPGSSATNGDTSPSVTPSTNGQLLFGAIWQADGASAITYTAGTSFTERQEVGTGALTLQTEDRIQSTAASVQATWTASTADRVIGSIATFK